MTSIPATTPPSTAPAPADGAAERAPSLLRLTHIELRKMVDTRAGRWLLIAIALLGLLVLGVIVIAGDESDRTFFTMMQAVQVPITILLPVVGVLAATSEWSQRTVLTTFAAVPRRGRVIAAKTLAGAALAVGAFAVSIVVAVVVGLLGPLFGKGGIEWAASAGELGQMLVYDILVVLLGVALGMALLNSAVAIVLNFMLPMIWSGVTFAITALQDLRPWLDINESWAPLVDGNIAGGDDWAKIGASALLWIALPLAIGAARIMRREIH